MSGQKIIDGLREAAAANFGRVDRVTINGVTWYRDLRPGEQHEALIAKKNKRIAELEAVLKLIASGMRGDRILSEFELSEIAHRALGT